MANVVAYGFYDLRSIFNQRVTDENIPQIRDAIQRTLDEYNRQHNAMLAAFADPTTQFQRTYKQLQGARLQPLDENGRARPIQGRGKYDIAFPIRDAGTAWGANYKALKKMTVEDANDIAVQAQMADRLWVRDQLFAALFTDVDVTYDDPEHGELIVKPLANGDETTYLRVNSVTSSTDSHFVGELDAIADVSDPFPAIYEDLMEHPENQGEVVTLASTSLIPAIKNLTGFYEQGDADIQQGLGTAILTGALGMNLPGRVVGKYSGGPWIGEWTSIPAGYMISLTTAGPRALGMRQEPEADLQGFYLAGNRDDHPFYERQWARHLGFGAQNRVGVRIDYRGSDTYTEPTGYTAPIV
jgi:hypothetical protein